MEKEAQKRTDSGSILKIRLHIGPMEKGLNGLAARRDKGTETITREESVIFFLLSRCYDVDFTGIAEAGDICAAHRSGRLPGLSMTKV